MSPARVIRRGLDALVVLALLPRAARADEACVVLCRPELKFEPTLSIGNLVGARVDDVASGETRTLPSDAGLQLVVAAGIPTQIPRIEITLEAIFPVPDTQPEVEVELNLVLITPAMTGGWLGAHANIIDQLSPGLRPGSPGRYTHKLDLEFDVSFAVFRWLPECSWLRNVAVEVSLDYLATGLPKRGDVLDGERYVENASGLSVSFLVVLPLAPLVPE